VLAALAVTASPARADLGNRNYFPFGERAATLANAGITSPNVEAAYYNPANLTRIGHPSLSVSGSTYLRYELSVDPLLVLQGEDQPFSASGFIAIPSTVISTYKVGQLWLATAVLVPEAIDFKNRSTFRTADQVVTILQQHSAQSLWLGGSIARELVPRLSVGLSVFVQKESQSSQIFTRVQRGLPTPTEVIEMMSNEDVSVLGLSAVLGVHYAVAPTIDLGLRLESPNVELTGSGDIYQSTLQAGSSSATDELSAEGVAVSRPVPADIGLGIAVRPTSWLELVADASVQLPAVFTTLDDPMLGTRTAEAELAPRASVGAELEIATNKWLRVGAFYNKSSVPDPRDAADTTQEDYVGATLGFAFLLGRTLTTVGVFGLQSNAKLYVQGADPPRLSDAHVRLYGGLLAVSYRL
jgi:hypothetical protein